MTEQCLLVTTRMPNRVTSRATKLRHKPTLLRATSQDGGERKI